MNVTKSITIAAALSASLALAQAFALQADDADAVIEMQPLQGMSFDAGAQHAVTYFLSENGQCKLVVTLSGEPESSSQRFTATRFEATIDGGAATRYVSDDGNVIAFDCEPSARTVSVHTGEQTDVAAR